MATRLAEAWIRHFWSANREMTWTEVETEHSLWLDERTLLLGKIDAQGLTSDGEPFFLDNKAGSKRKARFMDTEKSQWRMSPQALTYGVLMGERCRRFSVRWALKTEPPICDFEWYSYTEAELNWWKRELMIAANEIRHHRQESGILESFDPTGTANWPTNLGHCTKYGEAYRCPFRDGGCWALNFSYVPEEMTPRTISHLQLENNFKAEMSIDRVNTIAEEGKPRYNPEMVVLDASRVGDWMACHELYRRLWEGDGLTEENEALTIGSQFHEIIAAHVRPMIKETK